jgi:hypothetical protein
MSLEQQQGDRLIIEGVNEDNKVFRPSDWVERISDHVASFGPDHRLRYSQAVHPCMIDGRKCLVVAKDLREKDPVFYNYVLKFARDNRLRVQEDRRRLQDPVQDDRRQEAWDYDKLTL